MFCVQHNWQKGEKDKISPTTYSYIKILKPTPQKNNNSKCQFPTISHWRKTWFGMSQYLIFVVVSLTWTTVSFSFLIPCQIPSEVLYSLIWGEGGVGEQSLWSQSFLFLRITNETKEWLVWIKNSLVFCWDAVFKLQFEKWKTGKLLGGTNKTNPLFSIFFHQMKIEKPMNSWLRKSLCNLAVLGPISSSTH